MFKEVEDIYKSSMNDLKFRILEIEKIIPNNQKHLFKKDYIDKLSTPVLYNKENNCHGESKNKSNNCNESEDLDSNHQIQHHDHPVWAKKIYKKIVRKSHPDKNILNPHEDEKIKFENIYRDTVDVYARGDHLYLLSNAYDINLPVSFIDDELREKVDKKTGELKSQIVMMKKTHYWQWSSFNEKQKTDFLKCYFKDLGYSISEEEAVKSLRKKPERKTGTRPKQNIRNRKLQL